MAWKLLLVGLAILPLIFSYLLIQQIITRANSGSLQCRTLQLLLPGRVSSPGSYAYNASVESYWSQQEQQIAPSCVVHPQNEKDVAAAISILSKATAVTTALGIGHCPFAIRSGGHTPFAGSANIDRGVTIDLRSMNTITVNPDQTMVSVGPGNRWIDVYSKVEPLGLAVSGGRVSDIGVAGLTTGGGMSYFAPRYGFVCDNVENFEVVLASGTLVSANAKFNPDLWLALKGGSNNFGVVTRFDLRTFKQGDIWAGFIYNPIETWPAQIQAFTEMNAESEYDPYASLINSYGYSAASGGMAVANNIVYTKPQPYPAIFKPYTDIQPQLLNSLQIQNLTNYLLATGDFQPRGQRYLFVTRTYRNDADLLSLAFVNWNSTLQKILDVANLGYALSFQAVPVSITSKALTTGGNVLGLENTTEPLVLVLLTTQWSDAVDDVRVNAMAKSFFTELDTEAQGRNLTNSWTYLNYAAPFQDPIGGYGAVNKVKLRKVSKKYDPRGLFQTGVPGGFKLFT
ncbi:hypothetical protein BDR22DRAFT_895877 [Usnea florida]